VWSTNHSQNGQLPAVRIRRPATEWGWGGDGAHDGGPQQSPGRVRVGGWCRSAVRPRAQG
jgi:hypothetical protein